MGPTKLATTNIATGKTMPERILPSFIALWAQRCAKRR
jgi:hypothetical protein